MVQCARAALERPDRDLNVDRDDIQGIVMHGYRSLPFARYYLLGFAGGDPRPALARLVNDVSSCSEPRAEHRLQLALSASGLSALGLSSQVLAQFPREFRQGMAHPERSAALGDTIADAQKRAYQAMEKIHFDGMHYRKDIGHQAIKLSR